MSFVRCYILKQNWQNQDWYLNLFFEKSLSGDFFVRFLFELLRNKYFCSLPETFYPTYILEEKAENIFHLSFDPKRDRGKHDQPKFGTSLTFPKFGKIAEARQFKILAPAEFGFPRAKFKRVLDFVTANSFRCCWSIRLLVLFQRIAKKRVYPISGKIRESCSRHAILSSIR